MSPALLTIVILGPLTYLFKAVGPLAMGGGRQLPAWLERLANYLPAALLAALVVSSSVVNGRQWVFDARLAGLAAAAIALWFRLPFIVVVALAAVTTAALRAVV